MSSERYSDEQLEAKIHDLLALNPDATVLAIEPGNYEAVGPEHPGIADLVEAVVCDHLFLVDGSPVESYLFDTITRRKLYLGMQVPSSDASPPTGQRCWPTPTWCIVCASGAASARGGSGSRHR